MKKIFVFLSAAALIVSCATNDQLTPDSPANEQAADENGYWTGPEFSSDYKSDPNGVYSLRNVQKALDMLVGEGLTRADAITLEPTHHYVRFLPQNETDIYILHDSLDLDIFHYPFDHELTPEEQEAHLETKINGYGWQYCLVEPDFQMPTEMRWELLDYAYLQPDDEETLTRSGKSYQLSADVYSATIDKSIEITDTGDDMPETRASKWEPSGRLICDMGLFGPSPSLGIHKYLSLPGVYVRANTELNTGNTYTNIDGTFKIAKGKGGAFRNKVHYMAIWYRSDGKWKIHDAVGKADTKRSGDKWIKAPWYPVFGDDEFGFCANISFVLYDFFYRYPGTKKISSINVREYYGKSVSSGTNASSFVRGRSNPIEIYSIGTNINGTYGKLSLYQVQDEIAYRLGEANK